MATVPVDGAELYYEVHGEGRPLVLAHGAGGNAASWWAQVPFFVARGHRVVTFDHRGFGRSVCARGRFDPALFPADLRAILDAEGVERAAVVCQSMGGWTGLPSAVAMPERVSAVVLSGSAGGVWTDAVARALADIGRRVARDGGIVGPGGAALGATYRASDPAGAFLYDQIARFNPGLEEGAVGGIARVRLAADELARYDTPTLVISGDEDVLFPPEALASVARAIPGARLERFEATGHSVYFERPDRFNAVVDAFLAAIP